MFASLGCHLWLSTRVEPWLSAVLLGLVALVLALAAMPVGGALLRQACSSLRSAAVTFGSRPRIVPAARTAAGITRQTAVNMRLPLTASMPEMLVITFGP